tara:strand:+ start:1313 stop:1621 length:309 start_codon:yes stop_codon:yes gene_type:complete
MDAKAKQAEIAAILGFTLPTGDLKVNRGMPFINKGSKGVAWQFSITGCVKRDKQQEVVDAIGDLSLAYCEHWGMSKEEALLGLLKASALLSRSVNLSKTKLS